MWYVIGGMAFLFAWWRWKARDNPSMAMLGGIDSTVRNLQRTALDRLDTDPSGENPFDEQQMLRQTATVQGTIRFVYSIERSEGVFLHTVSSQLVSRRSKAYQVQCMLVAILTLQRQWTAAGLSGTEVPMRIEESARGTHLVFLEFTPERHERFRGALETSAIIQARRADGPGPDGT